jgi:hypothetical protein
MASDTYDLSIDQGADWSWTIRWKVGSTQRNAVPVNLTNFTARMQIRQKFESPQPIISLTTQNGRIVIGPDASFQTNIPSSTTATLPPGKFVYDFEAVSPTGIVTKLVRGTVSIIPEVTR